MTDQIVELLVARVGLSQDQAEKAVDTVLGFLKEHPEKLTELLGDDSPLAGVAGKLGKLFG